MVLQLLQDKNRMNSVFMEKLLIEPFISTDVKQLMSILQNNVLSQVFGMVKWLCWGHFPHVKFHCGPACPSERCPGYQRDNISHPGVQKSISRRHVIHVLPKKNSSFLCANQNFENDLKEWQVKG